MEIFSVEFLMALLAIIAIDLVLAGDNALLIGLAARDVPKELQKKVIAWGTAGAIIIRLVFTLVAVKLLEIDGLLLVGGIMLVFIAFKLLVDNNDHEVKAKNTFWGAMGTIIVADALMGIDNVIAVAGAAHGSFLLVVIGLLVSIPIVVWGSTFIIKWMEKFPIIITIGAGILAWTASKMIVKDGYVHEFFTNPLLKYGFEALVVILVVGIGELVKRNKLAKTAKTA